MTAANRFFSAESPLRMAFVAPRYHTNQHFAMKALQNRGVEVAFFALYRGVSEDYTVLVPRVLGDGLLFRLAFGVLRALGRRGETDRQAFRIAWGSPPLIRAWRALARFDPDVVVARPSALPFFLLAVAYARFSGKKTIIYTQGPRHIAASRKKRFLGKLLLKVLDAEWITPVEGDRRRFPAWDSRIHYVQLPAYPTDGTSPPPPPRRNGPLRVLTVGKLEPRKNLPMMVEAFVAATGGRQAVLTIVGECSSERQGQNLEQLCRKIDESGAVERVRIRTNVPFEEMKALYDSHDVFVLPSSREPLGMSVLEAMARGMPVICSDSAGVRWAIEPGGNGYVFRSDDVDDLTGMIGRVIRDDETIRRMGERSFDLMRGRYSQQRYALLMLWLATGRLPDLKNAET